MSEAATLRDPEQRKAFDDSIELLLAAGYFRARIANLGAFDKVIGGLTWCVTNSLVEVDVDLFFQEEANIKFRVKLGEQIEKAVVQMKCPYPLQAFQISMLDCKSIFPVIQWLVKRVLEVREETGDLLRVISESVFGKDYKLPSDIDFENRKGTAVNFIKGVAYRYRPTRKLRRRGDRSAEEEQQVQSTLLEYGHKAYTAVQTETKKKSQRKDLEDTLGGDGKSKTDQQRDADEKRFRSMMSGMDEANDDISNKRIRGILGMDADAIQKMNAEYNEIKAQSTDAVGGKAFEEESHRRHVEALNRQIE